MWYDDRTPPDKIIIWTFGLLSKYGFDDGDIFQSYTYGVDESHELLRNVVKTYILPKLDQRVETYDINTIHNPIRAESVDGVDVPWEDSMNHVNAFKLTPEFIEVTREEILAVM